MKVVVTGAAGFIGSALSETLLDRTDITELVGVDSFSDNYPRPRKIGNLERLRDEPRFQFQETDILTTDLDRLLDGATYVFHQAGQPGVRGSWGQSFGTYIAQNIDATQRLLEAANRSTSLKRFVYASSSSVYGNSLKFPTSELDLPRPYSPYGVTKLAAEHLCSLYADNFGLPTVSLRYFTVYGPRQRPDMAFDKFLRAAFRRETIRIYGSGQQVRDFTYVDDIVAGNCLASASTVKPGSIYNLCGGSSVNLEDVLKMVEKVTGESLDIERGSPVAGDVDRTGGIGINAEKDLRWTPAVGLEDGLRRQAEYVQKTL